MNNSIFELNTINSPLGNWMETRTKEIEKERNERIEDDKFKESLQLAQLRIGKEQNNIIYPKDKNHHLEQTSYPYGIVGVNKKSAKRLIEIMKQNFHTENCAEFRELIQLAKDELSLAKIDETKFVKSLVDLNEDQRLLAYAYYKTINNNNLTYLVDIVLSDEELSKLTQTMYSMWKTPSTTGQDVTSDGGGASISMAKDDEIGNSTDRILSVVVPDQLDSIEVASDWGGGKPALEYKKFQLRPQSVLAHEVLGHGVARLTGYGQGNTKAIQMSNLALRAMGIYDRIRTGKEHHNREHLYFSEATKVPEYFQLPNRLKRRIAIEQIKKHTQYGK